MRITFRRIAAYHRRPGAGDRTKRYIGLPGRSTRMIVTIKNYKKPLINKLSQQFCRSINFAVLRPLMRQHNKGRNACDVLVPERVKLIFEGAKRVVLI